MNIATQISKYFAAAADATAKGEAVPFTKAGNKLTHLVDGRRYFGEIRKLLNGLGKGTNISKQFFYMTGWWLHMTTGPGHIETAIPSPGRKTPVSATTMKGDTMPPFRLEDEGPAPYPLMAYLLAKAAGAGVDVKVMGFVNPLILTKTGAAKTGGAGGYWNVITGTVKSIEYLRQYMVGGGRTLARRVCALTMGHTFGAMHMKMVVAHDGSKPRAFVGGIDFVPDRISGNVHSSVEKWHDVAIEIDGPAVQACYNLFRNLWNEQIARRPIARFLLSGRIVKGVENGTKPVPVRTFLSTGTGKHHVQVCRTLPQYNFKTKLAYGSTPLSFTPNGKFEVTVTRRKAIASASLYIYIEDPTFWSQDVMGWINKRIKSNANVKVILLMGAPDPTDPPAKGELVEAVNKYLLPGLGASMKARIGFFVRKNVIVHSKVMIIDDHWLFLGSANCMRRSLYTDGEISVGALDKDDKIAKNLRVDLWGEHFGKTPQQRSSLKSLNRALAVWNPAWGSSPPYALPTSLIDKRPLPLPAAARPFDPSDYKYRDCDSRMVFL